MLIDSQGTSIICEYSHGKLTVQKEFPTKYLDGVPFSLHTFYEHENQIKFTVFDSKNPDELAVRYWNNDKHLMEVTSDTTLLETSFIRNSINYLRRYHDCIRADPDFHCDLEKVLKIESIELNKSLFVFSLSPDGHLRLNGMVIHESVSSFIIHDCYLHLTSRIIRDQVSFLFIRKLKKKHLILQLIFQPETHNFVLSFSNLFISRW